MGRNEEHYYVDGIDGQLYGPANLHDLQAWILEGRFGLDSPVYDSETHFEMKAREMPGLFEIVGQPVGPKLIFLV